jgi:signal transduction histidine kinase
LTFLKFIVLFLLLPPALIHAQEPAHTLAFCDSLQKNIYEPGFGGYFHDARMRMAALRALPLVPRGDTRDSGWLYYYAGLGYAHEPGMDIDTLRGYCYVGLSLAQSAHVALLIARCCESLIHIEFEMQESAKVEALTQVLQSIVDTTKNRPLLQDAYSSLGSYYEERSYYSTAQDYLLKSIALRRQQINAPDPGTAANQSAPSAAPNQTAPNQSTGANPVNTGYARQCYTLAQLYLKTDMPDKAYATLSEGIPYARPDQLVSSRYNSSFVQIFCRLGQIDSALFWFHKYIEPMTGHFHSGRNVPAEIIQPNLAIAQYYLRKQSFDKAWPFLQNADTMITRTSYPFLVYEVQRTLGKYYLLTGSYAKALPLLTSALPVAATFSKENYTDILKDIASVERKSGNQSAALEYYDRYTAALDSLTKEKISTTFADQETRYETNRKELRIASLDKDNRLKALEISNSNTVRILLIVGLAALGIIALLLYFFYRRLSVANEQFARANGELARANETKARLFGIVSHDLRSPVSRIVQLLQIQKQRPDLLDAATRQRHEQRITLASESLLETMEDLLLWSKSQMQYFTPLLAPITLSEVIEKELQLLHESIVAKEMTVHRQIPPGLSRNTDENFLSVILRNLLQNAVKYGNAGSPIDIFVTPSAIVISNEASAADPAILNDRLDNRQVDSSTSGLGLQIAAQLAASIHSRLSFTGNGHHLTAALTWLT